MTKEDMTRAILNSTIQKYIADISSDPDRSIRKLIDLGMNFSTGRFQKKFFNTAHTMLENRKSGYYTLVKNIVADVDGEIIRKFGMNIGYNSCTYGAKIIRENEEKFGFNIPWAVLFSLPDSESASYISKADEYISEGCGMGIYTYMIFTGTENIPLLDNIAAKHSGCAFFIFTSAEAAGGPYLSVLKKHPNIMTVIRVSEQTPHPEISESAKKLKSSRMLYGAYMIYTESGAEKIISGEGIHPAKSQFPFIFLISDGTVSGKSREKVAEYVKNERTKHTSPFLIIDTFTDLLTIDTIISDDSCSVRFDEKGDGHTFEKKLPFNMNGFSLTEILKNAMPRKKHCNMT